MATYSAFCPISGFPQEGARSFRAVPRGPVIPSEDDTIKIAMLTSAALRDASGGRGCRRTTVQKRATARDGIEGGGKEEGAPRGYPREGAGKFFPLGCRQKGNYFNCGQPRSTKLHPMFLLPLSLSLSLFCFLSSSTCETPHADSVSFLRRVSCVIFLPHPFSLLRFVGEHIPSLVAVTAGVSRLARVCLPS